MCGVGGEINVSHFLDNPGMKVRCEEASHVLLDYKYSYLRVCLVFLLLVGCQVLHGLKAFLLFDAARHTQARRPHAQQQVGQAGVLLLLDVGNVAHHDVDQGVLHQGEKDEDRAARHEDIDSLERGEISGEDQLD